MSSSEDFLPTKENVPEFLTRDDQCSLLFRCSKQQLIWLAEYFNLVVMVTEKKNITLMR